MQKMKQYEDSSRYLNNQVSGASKQSVIELHCTVADRNYCYPGGTKVSWADWIGFKGYSNRSYEIAKIESNGLGAIVYVVPR